MALSLIIAGVGQGLFLSPNSRALMGAAPDNEQGVASGVLATARVVGQSLSVAAAGAVFTASGAGAAGAALQAGRQTLSAAQAQALQQTFVSGFHAAVVVSAVLAGIGVVAALAQGGERAVKE
jgi:hypothetical protein